MLQTAWEQVRRNKGAAGIDGETLKVIEAQGVEQVLTELRELLESGKYRPLATRRVYIPKPGRPKERRPLSIPRVRDRIVQTAARLVLAPLSRQHPPARLGPNLGSVPQHCLTSNCWSQALTWVGHFSGYTSSLHESSGLVSVAAYAAGGCSPKERCGR